MNSLIRTLIVDDHSLFRETLAHALSNEPGFVVVANHGTLSEAIRTLSAEAVDVVLLDYDLGVERGSSLVNWAADSGYRGKFLVLTAGVAPADAMWMIQHQVSGIFLKENPFRDLLAAIRAVARGGKWLDQPFLKMAVSRLTDGNFVVENRPALFTQRERATLRFLVEGCANKEIGERFGISESAVKGTVQRLFDKLGVRSRGQLISVAIQKYQNYL